MKNLSHIRKELRKTDEFEDKKPQQNVNVVVMYGYCN
jgi:hypothetical protein